MENKELKSIDMTAKFSNFQVINKDFTRCRCNVFYTGRNRNYSDITEEALQKFIARKGYANVPVVAHLFKDESGKYRVGGHDSKLILSNDGIEFVNECVPFGVIPEDCHPSMDLITERSGEQRQYFSVDIILWTHRYPIMEAAFSDEVYFNQSMELNFDEISMDGDYTVVHDFSMSALCLLNRSLSPDENCEPCFESSRVKSFSLDEDKFKQNFELMLNKLKQYESATVAVQNKETENNNPNTKGEIKMDLTKFSTLLSEIKYGDDCIKYSLLGADENRIFVVDREEEYKVYAVGYAEVDDNIVINWNERTEGNIAYTEKPENEEKSNMSVFYDEMTERLTKEIEAKYDAKLEAKVKEISDDAESRLSEMKEKYLDIQNSYAVAKDKLDKFEAIEAEKAKENHINAVKETLERFENKIGKTPEFIYYKAKVDYEKVDIDEMEKELTLMTGDILMNKKETSKTFSYNPTSVNVKTVTENETSSRYGNLLDAYMN